MYDTILVPTDGSEHAVRAAEHARYLADAFDATVHVVTVVDVQTAAGPFDAGGVSAEFVARLESGARRRLRRSERPSTGRASRRPRSGADPPRRSWSTPPTRMSGWSRWGPLAGPDSHSICSGARPNGPSDTPRCQCSR